MAIFIDNLDAIGIPAEPEGIDTETYFGQLAEGACVICRSGWLADYPTYDNFMYDLFSTDALGGNNFGYSNEQFDELMAQAKAETDIEAAVELYRQAEEILLDEDIGVIPINWYNGRQVFNGDKIASLLERPDGYVAWESVALRG